jgi:hypothetical protein
MDSSLDDIKRKNTYKGWACVIFMPRKNSLGTKDHMQDNSFMVTRIHPTLITLQMVENRK